MTWFLDSASAAPTSAAPALEGQVPGWLEQAAGSAQDVWWRRDSWQSEQQYRDDLARDMMRALGGYQAVYPKDLKGMNEFEGQKTRGQYLARMIGQVREFDTEGKFSSLPGSPEEFDAEILRRRKRDFDENRAMLDRGDSGTARVAGEMAGTVLEPASLATLPLGGSMKNAGRFILGEAALGAASDLPGVIREQSVADDLGFTPSNPVTELAMSAAVGGAFAGVMVGAGRALSYGRARVTGEASARPADVTGPDYQADIDTAEADLRAGRDTAAPRQASADMLYSGPIDDGYYTAIRGAESGGNDAAKNPRSSATGRYQFTQGTWATVMRNHPDLGLTANGRLDASQQEVAIRAFTEDNAENLRGAGIPVTRGNLYAAHFLGAGDARRVLRAAGDQSVTDLLSPAVIQANPFLRNMRVDDFRAWTVRKTNGGKGGVVADTPAMAAGGAEYPTARRADWFSEVSTPGGMSVDVRYRVVDMSDLQRASGDLQPRDRSRAASDEQVAGIARNLDPSRLMPSPESTGGAPIVGADMMVESGNGRIAALNRAADQHPERYQAYVRAIEDAGFEVPEGVARPALVAERITDLDIEGRRRFVRESNTSSIGRMSATEQAGVDADYLSQNAFDGYRPGRGLNSPDNAEFVRRVFSAMPQAERAALMTADGRLNIDGLRRLRQALFARAFDAQDLLKMLAETESPAVENLLRMLEDLAPDWAAFRAAVDAGYIRSEFDITDPLMDTVRMIARARIEPREGQSVIGALRDKLLQGDMFATRDAELTDAIIGVFYKGDRARAPDASAEILTRYMSEAEIAGRADIDDLFAVEAGMTPTAALREAVQAQDARAPMPARADATAESLQGPAGGQPDIRVLDSMKTEDGAQSAALTRATDTELRELRDAPVQGPFGPVLRQFEGKPKEAIAELRRLQAGDAIGALRHPDIGPIDLVWGAAGTGPRDGHGLAKIDRRHPEVVPELQERLAAATTVLQDGPNRIRLTNGSDIFVIRKDIDGARKTWLLTGYEARTERAKQRIVGGSTGSTDGLPESSSPSAPLQSKDSALASDFQDAGIMPEEAEAIAQARVTLEADPDLTLRMGEGQDTREASLADLLDDIDQDEALMRSLTSCNLKGSPK